MNKGRLNLRQLLLWLEKRHYLFRRYPRGATASLLFMGCYFPAYFPRTTRALCALAARHGTLCAFDCCGKPLALEDIGGTAAHRVSLELNQRLQRLQVQELIAVCPNCHAYLQGRLNVPVRSVYEKLAEWDLPQRGLASGRLFIPCPDRQGQELRRHIAKILPLDELEPIANVPCCGLGGGATAYCADVAQKLAADVKQQTDGTLYTYCASCAGQFQRQGITPVRHLLAEALHVEEAPDTSHSLYNRLQFKIANRKDVAYDNLL